MSDSPIVRTYQRRVFYRAASNGLQEVQEVREDFIALQDVYEKALESQEWCYGNQNWDMVLDFMRVLKDFLHLQGYWRKAEECSLYAIEAAKQLQQDQADWMFYAGLILDEQGKYEKAEERYYQPGLVIAQTEENIAIQAEITRRRGWLAQAQENRATAEKCYREAIDLHQRAGDRLGEARSWRHLALLAIDMGNYKDAQNHLLESLKLAQDYTNREAQRVQAGASLDLGRIAWRQGRLADANQHLEDALDYSQRAQDQLLEADIRFQIEILVEAQKSFSEVAELYLDRLNLAKAANDRRGHATALIALGNLALQHARHDKAKEYYEELSNFDDPLNQAIAITQLGTLAYQQNDYQQAIAYLEEALNAFSQLERPQERAICHHQLGLVAQARELWSEAEIHFQRSLEIRQDLGLLNEVFSSVYHLGRLAQQQGLRERAIRYYQEALDMGEQAAINSSNLEPIRQVLKRLKSLRGRNPEAHHREKNGKEKQNDSTNNAERGG